MFHEDTKRENLAAKLIPQEEKERLDNEKCLILRPCLHFGVVAFLVFNIRYLLDKNLSPSILNHVIMWILSLICIVCLVLSYYVKNKSKYLKICILVAQVRIL